MDEDILKSEQWRLTSEARRVHERGIGGAVAPHLGCAVLCMPHEGSEVLCTTACEGCASMRDPRACGAAAARDQSGALTLTLTLISREGLEWGARQASVHGGREDCCHIIWATTTQSGLYSGPL